MRQVAVAGYRPDWWPANTFLLIRRVKLDPGQVSAGPRSRRRRTLHVGQRALPIPELAEAGAIYGYSFILTNLDVSAPDKAAAAEHWYRHRTTIGNLFRDSKHGAALRHLPIAIPGRLTRHARHLTLRLPPGHGLLPEVLARLRALPVLP